MYGSRSLEQLDAGLEGAQEDGPTQADPEGTGHKARKEGRCTLVSKDVRQGGDDFGVDARRAGEGLGWRDIVGALCRQSIFVSSAFSFS